MLVLVWDYKTKRYDAQYTPPEWKLKVCGFNMREIINCASCGDEIEFGRAYTSLRYHNDMGFGYSVCDKCHEKEVKEELEVRYGKQRKDRDVLVEKDGVIVRVMRCPKHVADVFGTTVNSVYKALERGDRFLGEYTLRYGEENDECNGA